MLPKHVGIVMLSATVSNIEEFSDWVSWVTGKRLHVLKTLKRPVPLNHHVYFKKIVEIKKHNENFNEQNYKNFINEIHQ